ncbi:MAG: acyl-CoA reductase [Bacteroidota bacterium]
MTQDKITDTFSLLAPIFELLGENKHWSGFQLGISENEFEELNAVIQKQFYLNGWFTEENVRKTFKAWSGLLRQEKLKSYTENYSFSENPKRIGIIMAGNIPLVGFHDFLSVLLSGHKVVIKLSSDDKTLLPTIIKLLLNFNPGLKESITISEYKLAEIDAIIATGSNNSMNYFEQYFGKYPHIFRKNRTSVAVINGNESKEELALLGEDIFTYFGLGCRNVSQVFLPKDFKLDNLIEAIFPHSDVVNHHKYTNNYDYNKAIHLMGQQQILDNGFVLFKESEELFSPLAMLFYHHYENQAELDEFITKNQDNIQAIVGHNYIPFGQAQKPELNDFADGVDTMEWLSKL